MEYKWSLFPYIKNSEELENYFIDKEYSHGKYCHYTRLDTIEKILSKKRLFLSCVNKFNDLCDRQQFGDDRQQKYYYSICFSTGDSENLALWYLYSGINGKGGRIRFSSKRIKDLVKGSKFELYKYGKSTNLPYGKPLVLEQGVNMDLKFKDVLYWQDQKKNVRLKYNTMTNNNLSIQDFEKSKDKNVGFIKDTIWYHEKETRLLLELTNDAKDFVKENYDYVVVMSFPDDFNHRWFNIELAPEIEDTSIIDEDDNYKTLRNCQDKTSCIHVSMHAGKVKMNLCKNSNRSMHKN